MRSTTVSISIITLLIVWITPSLAQEPIRVNCGSEEGGQGPGGMYMSDRSYSSGSWGYIGESATNTSWIPPVVGGVDPDLKSIYLTHRNGMNAYRFDISSGDYYIRLHFNERIYHGSNHRLFRIRESESILIDSIDVFSLAGSKDWAIWIDFKITVNSYLQLDFENITEDSRFICAIEVVPAQTWNAEAPKEFHFAGFGHLIATTCEYPPYGTAGYHLYTAGNSQPLTTQPVPHGYHLFEGLGSGSYQVRWVALDNSLGPLSETFNVTVRNPDSTNLPNRVFHIQISPESLDALHLDPYSDIYQPAQFIADGQTYNCRVRFRGASSRGLAKKSWKIKFFSEKLFESIDKLNLKAEYEDQALLQELAAFQLYQQEGIPASQTEVIDLLVNNRYMGQYIRVEHLDKFYLSRLGLPENTPLYRVWDIRLVPHDNIEEGYDSRSENQEHTALLNLLNKVATTDPAYLLQLLDSLLNIDAWASYIASNIALSVWDTDGGDLFLLLTDQGWIPLPWDHNGALGMRFYEPGFNIYADPLAATMWSTNNVWFNQLIHRLWSLPDFRQSIWQKLEKIFIKGMFKPTEWRQFCENLADETYTNWRDDWLGYGWNNLEFKANERRDLGDYADKRWNWLQEKYYIFGPWNNRLVINEFSGGDPDYPDPFGESDPYVELYNASSKEIALEKVALSFNLREIDEIPLPDIILSPGERVLLWADGQPTQGSDHLTKALNTQGGEIGLFMPMSDDVSIRVDAVFFGPRPSSGSHSRTPDGAETWAEDVATPGEPNPQSTFNMNDIHKSFPQSFSLASPYPNPFNQTVTFIIGMPIAAKLKVCVLNTQGKEVVSLFHGMHKKGYHRLTFDAKGLANGTYFIHTTILGKMNKVCKVILIK